MRISSEVLEFEDPSLQDFRIKNSVNALRFFFSFGQSNGREEVENLILVVDKLNPFGVQADKMGAIFAIVSTDAGFYAE